MERDSGPPVVAIDGPAGSGKSTVARGVAQRLGLALVDSGSMYRAVTLVALEQGIALDDGEALARAAETVRSEYRTDVGSDGVLRVFLAKREVTGEIRSDAVGESVSVVSVVREVRETVSGMQRDIVSNGAAVVEGRDIGTAVFPDARMKVFLEASPEERVRRRLSELKEGGRAVTEDEVRTEIRNRDAIDSSREHSPLARAVDAVVIDSDGMTAAQVVEAVVFLCSERGLVGGAGPLA